MERPTFAPPAAEARPAERAADSASALMKKYESERYLEAMKEDFRRLMKTDPVEAKVQFAALQRGSEELLDDKISVDLDNVLRLPTPIYGLLEGDPERFYARLYQVVVKILHAVDPIVYPGHQRETAPPAPAAKPAAKEAAKPQENDPVDALMSRFEDPRRFESLLQEFRQMHLEDAAEQMHVLKHELSTLRRQGVTEGVVKVLNLDAARIQALSDGDYERFVDRLGDIVASLVYMEAAGDTNHPGDPNHPDNRIVSKRLAKHERKMENRAGGEHDVRLADLNARIKRATDRLSDPDEVQEAFSEASERHGEAFLEDFRKRLGALESADPLVAGEALKSEFKNLLGIKDGSYIELLNDADLDEAKSKIVGYLKEADRIARKVVEGRTPPSQRRYGK